jgi:hypothetical protein
MNLLYITDKLRVEALRSADPYWPFFLFVEIYIFMQSDSTYIALLSYVNLFTTINYKINKNTN